MKQMIKSFGLLIATNFLIFATLSIVLNLLGIKPYLTRAGIDYQMLAIFCLIWGLGGSFISLGLSRIMAKWMMKVKVIDPSHAGASERELLETVYRLAKAAGMTTMPEVGIYDSPEVNAFATGPTRNRSLVAVSSGLLYSMDRREVEGVLAHEVAHIVNGDMVTMTLIQGVVNAFVMFIARVVAWGLAQNVEEERRPLVQMMVTMVLEMVIGFFGVMVVAWFSRQREYRADAGGARLAGRDKMVAALDRLRRTHDRVDTGSPAMASMKISGGGSGFLALFSTHPPLEQRIDRLQRANLT